MPVTAPLLPFPVTPLAQVLSTPGFAADEAPLFCAWLTPVTWVCVHQASSGHTHARARVHTHTNIYIYIYIYKVKLKCSHYRPSVAQRVGRGIALLFHDHGTRRG